ncbi:DAK2 domain-containing protein [symbiont of Argiope bruennichi]|uniref:DAK2 domain-containing protein n=1 Tax=symbiont of Argiope bruennichi TaxID=2810479 RepID=UPI003DA4983A
MTKILLPKKLKEILFSGANNLINSSKEINQINFFPVPDSDTGTNMSITIQSGINNILDLDTDDVGLIFQQMSEGMLIGARGNSGIILSQFFVGISRYFSKNLKFTVKNFLKSFSYGSIEAYNAVYVPKEGTILSVIQKIARIYKKFRHIVYFENFFPEFIEEVKNIVAETTQEMEILKEKKVVDAGALGLLKVFEGMKDGFFDHKIVNYQNLKDNNFQNHNENLESFIINSNCNHGYCTEFLILLNEKQQKTFNLKEFRKKLEKNNFSSIITVKANNIIKVHAHALDPDKLLNVGLKHGQLLKIKIDNMNFQTENHLLFSENDNPSNELQNPDNYLENKKLSGLFLITNCQKIPNIFEDSYLKEIINVENDNFSSENLKKIKSQYQFKDNIFLTDDVKVFKIISDYSDNCHVFLLPSIIYALPLIYSFSPEQSPLETLSIFEELSKEVTAFYIKNSLHLSLNNSENLNNNGKFSFFLLEDKKIINKLEDKVALLLNFLEEKESEIFEGITIFLSFSFSKQEEKKILNFLKLKKYKWELYNIIMESSECILMLN